MFERVPKLKAVLEDPKNLQHRQFIERGIVHQRPMVIAIRDGFKEPLLSEVREHEIRKQGKRWAKPITEMLSGNAGYRFAYAKYKLVLPEKPAMDMIEFAIELGNAVDSLSTGDFKTASFPADFSPEKDVFFLNHFSMKGDKRVSMSFLTTSAHKLRRQFFLCRNLQVLRDTPADGTTKQWVEAEGINHASLTYSADGTVFFSQKGCKRTMNLPVQSAWALSQLYQSYLNPIAYRITFAFSPEL